MHVIDQGHEYLLNALDGDYPQALVFVKREGEGYPGNIGSHAGTNMQEVLRALINRVRYVNNQIKHPANTMVIARLQEAVYYLEWRAADRHGRLPAFQKLISEKCMKGTLDNIEDLPTCPKCGHIGCDGSCHQ